MIGHWFGADKVEERERGTRKKIKTQRRTDFRFDALITIYVVQFHNLSLSLFLSLSFILYGSPSGQPTPLWADDGSVLSAKKNIIISCRIDTTLV